MLGRSGRKGAKRKNTPTRVCVCVQHLSRGKGKVLNMKTTHKGWFSCPTCIQVEGKASNTKTHQRGCVFVSNMHWGGRKGVECENTPIVGGFHAQRAESEGGTTTKMYQLPFKNE